MSAKRRLQAQSTARRAIRGLHRPIDPIVPQFRAVVAA
jgi:hypothetical protein